MYIHISSEVVLVCCLLPPCFLCISFHDVALVYMFATIATIATRLD